jgi:mono/diheme cytochrome c family protein
MIVFAIFFSLEISASSRNQQRRGESIYNASGCAHCHRIHGTGGEKGPDLSGVGRRRKRDQIRRQIVDGTNRMPPFKDELEEKDLKELIAYLHSCRDKKR